MFLLTRIKSVSDQKSKWLLQKSVYSTNSPIACIVDIAIFNMRIESVRHLIVMLKDVIFGTQHHAEIFC